MKDKKVVVTGGQGYIGSYIVSELAENNEVHVIDNQSAETNSYFYHPKAEYHHLDILDPTVVDVISGADYVFHLAAQSRIGPCIENPELAYQTNTIGTLRLLAASLAGKVGRFIYSSTSAMYGLRNPYPYREEMAAHCLNPYSSSKYAGEEAVSMYHDLYGLETVSLRYFNVAGQDHTKGALMPTKGQYAPVLGIFLRQYLGGKALTVVGSGEQTRDFVYVKDVADANILVAEHPSAA